MEARQRWYSGLWGNLVWCYFAAKVPADSLQGAEFFWCRARWRPAQFVAEIKRMSSPGSPSCFGVWCSFEKVLGKKFRLNASQFYRLRRRSQLAGADSPNFKTETGKKSCFHWLMVSCSFPCRQIWLLHLSFLRLLYGLEPDANKHFHQQLMWRLISWLIIQEMAKQRVKVLI